MIIRHWSFNQVTKSALLGFVSVAWVGLVAAQVPTQASTIETDYSELDIELGRALFERNWVSSPASTVSSDGLGPFYNARSCAACHIDSGPGLPDSSLVLRIRSAPAQALLGQQIQTQSVQGVGAEIRELEVSYSPRQVVYPDGERVELRVPHYAIEFQGSWKASPETIISARIAPDLHGLGWLSRLFGAGFTQEVLVRDGVQAPMFGWQGESPSLSDQSARALSIDMGLSNPIYPDPSGDCTSRQELCVRHAQGTETGRSPEINEQVFNLLLAYVQNLQPPVSPGLNDARGGSGQLGQALFEQVGCQSCHWLSIDAPFEGYEGNPYSDFLKYDMGEGLADHSLDEESVLLTRWRTAPLWGLAEKSAMEGFFLHDGRARTIEEAILWHAGEALSSRDAFKALEREQRQHFLNFLSNL